MYSNSCTKDKLTAEAPKVHQRKKIENSPFDVSTLTTTPLLSS
jgi:hypothetical protein